MTVINHIFPDSPTNTFATLNVLDAESATLSNGNLAATINSGPNNSTTIIPSSGTWYWEVYITDHTNIYMGIQKIETQESGYSQDAVAVNNIGNVYYDASYQNKDALPSIATGDIISVFWDIDNKKIWFAQNGQFYDATGTTHPTLTLSQVASGVNGYDYSSNIPNSAKPFFGSSATSAGIICNFGQDSSFGGNKTSGSANAQDANSIGDFYYSVPSGAKALCTANLPDPDIDPNANNIPKNHFDIFTYPASGSSTQQFAHGFSFTPDLLWIKNRSSSSGSHWIYDRVRGLTSFDLTSGKGLSSASTGSEGGDVALGAIIDDTTTSVTYDLSTHITIRDGNSAGVDTYNVNYPGHNYVLWAWKAGGAPTADNTATSGAMTANSVSVDGTLQSSYTPSGSPTIYPTRMSVNTKAGFSIISYTSNPSSTSGITDTLPHGFTSAPELIIIKQRNSSNDWMCWHKNLSTNYNLNLNGTGTQFSASGGGIRTPNANTIDIGGSLAVNSSWSNTAQKYICYAWHSVAGYSAFGSYTGNGSTDGPFVYTGFRPAFVMIKKTDGATSWWIVDSARDEYNPTKKYLIADTSVEESNGTDYITADFLSNGFKIRNISNAFNSGNHIYMAFAEQPSKYSNAR